MNVKDNAFQDIWPQMSSFKVYPLPEDGERLDKNEAPVALTKQCSQVPIYSSCITNSAPVGPSICSIHTGDAEHGTILSSQVNTIEAPLEDIAGTSLRHARKTSTAIDGKRFCCWHHNNSAIRSHWTWKTTKQSRRLRIMTEQSRLNCTRALEAVSLLYASTP